MLPLLLAQLVAPPLQNSPVRLPGPGVPVQRPRERQPLPIEDPDVRPGNVPAAPPPATPAQEQLQTSQPVVRGLTVYSPTELKRILASCSGNPLGDRLKDCAAALTARLVGDGYLNTRVYIQALPAPGWLEVVEGRIVEIQVSSNSSRLARRVRRLLTPLQGSVLNLANVEDALERLRRLPGIAEVRGRLSKLGSDPAQGVFSLSVQPGASAWQGELSLRNDGSNGSGEGRATGTLLKGDLVTEGDTLLLYGELNSDNTPSLGAVISSISYTLPLADAWSFTGSFGYSRRNLIELPDSLDGTLASSQYQGLGQLEWVLTDSLHQRWSVFAGFSGNRSNTYLAGQALPADQVPASVRAPQNGYLRVGVNASGQLPELAWGGNLFLLQGIAAATPSQQRQELANAGINPGSSSALAGVVSAAWLFAPSWQLNLRVGGQWAFHPLTNPMQFTLGSDAGIRGLPGQLISGDSGWLSTAETSWTFWRNRFHALQLVPFIGVGGVQTTLKGVTSSDTVGSGGILARWLAGNAWQLELGWVEQFETNDNVGTWTDWALGKGLYAQVKYRF